MIPRGGPTSLDSLLILILMITHTKIINHLGKNKCLDIVPLPIPWCTDSLSICNWAGALLMEEYTLYFVPSLSHNANFSNFKILSVAYLINFYFYSGFPTYRPSNWDFGVENIGEHNTFPSWIRHGRPPKHTSYMRKHSCLRSAVGGTCGAASGIGGKVEPS